MLNITFLSESTLTELVLLALAFVLSAVIGVERQRLLKSAGIRTHALVGMGSAVFTLVSAYGFDSVLGTDVNLDPSRIAAQIVSGIGFLGAGVIFVRQNVVNGLTTAASIWVTASIGMACGASMPVLAISATLLYLLAVGALSYLGKKIPTVERDRLLVVTYRETRGVLRTVLTCATELGFQAQLTRTSKQTREGKYPTVVAEMRFQPIGRLVGDDLVARLSELKGVVAVHALRSEEDNA